MTATPLSAAERSAFVALAHAAYKVGANAIGHRYSTAAAIPEGSSLEPQRHASLLEGLRLWISFGTLPSWLAITV